jgi:hypothetical protein
VTAGSRGPSGPARRGGVPLIGADLILAVLVRPDLWWTAIGAVRRFAAPGWWRRPPRQPRPDPDLWRFRMITAYGDPDARPTPGDAVDYLEWCREVRLARRSAPGVVAGTVRRRIEGGDG